MVVWFFCLLCGILMVFIVNLIGGVFGGDYSEIYVEVGVGIWVFIFM